MTIAVDTNIFIALWSAPSPVTDAVLISLERASDRGALVIAPAVYAELIAAPGRDLHDIDTFLARTDITVDWQLDEAVWRMAGLACRGYAERRRTQRGDRGPKRLLADFIIGAHAVALTSALLTFNKRIYRAAFPTLTILEPNVPSS